MKLKQVLDIKKLLIAPMGLKIENILSSDRQSVKLVIIC